MRVEMNMSVNRAVPIAAAADPTELRSLYGQAVSHGAVNTLCTVEEERAHGTLRLLTLATLRLPDLHLYAYLLDALDEDVSVEPVPPIVTSTFASLLPVRCGSRTARSRPTGTSSATSPAPGSSGRSSAPTGGCAAISRAGSCRWLMRRGGVRSRSRARSPPPPATGCSSPASSPTHWRGCSCST